MANSEQEPCQLPHVTDAVLVEMSGMQGLSQNELWAIMARERQGALATWALKESARLSNIGVSPEDAFLIGAAWAVTALARQITHHQETDNIRQLFEDSPQHQVV